MNSFQITKFYTVMQLNIFESAFDRFGLRRPPDFFRSCLEENIMGERTTLLAYKGEVLVGCGHLKVHSEYPPFRKQQIPEISDLIVFPDFRQQGIASLLLEALENLAAQTSNQVGIGVGLHKAYGPAQRLYCRRGYIPDGQGLQYNDEEVKSGTVVKVDDALNLYLQKELPKAK